MTIDYIIDYVLDSPTNTNKAVLKDMLEDLTSGGGGGSFDYTIARVETLTDKSADLKIANVSKNEAYMITAGYEVDLETEVEILECINFDGPAEEKSKVMNYLRSCFNPPSSFTTFIAFAEENIGE